MSAVTTNARAFSCLAGMLTSPGETFKVISRRPTWVAPIIIAILVAIVGNAVYYLRVNPDWEQRVRNRIEQHQVTTGETMAPEQVAQQVATAKTLGNFFILLPALSVPLFCFGVAGFYLLAFGLVFLRSPSFKKVLSVVAWSEAVVKTIGVAIVIIVLMAVDTERLKGFEPANSNLVQSNLSVLLPRNLSPASTSLATSVDVFTIWFLILLTIGFGVVGLGSQKIATWKITTLVFGLWLAWVFIKVGMAFVFGY
jgi:Yip1 domain